MKGDKIKIIATQPTPSGICAIPNIGEPIPVGMIDGYIGAPCIIEYWENGGTFYRVVTEDVEPPKELCEV